MSKSRLPLPERRNLVNPIWLARWMSWFVRGWFGTRNYRGLRMCVPFVLLSVSLLVVTALSERNSEENYQRILKDSLAANNDGTTEIALRRLIQLSPRNESYLFQLAEFHLKAGEHGAAFRLLNQLAPFDRESDGYSRAHAKMVELSLDPESGVSVSTDRKLFHAKRLLEADPKNAKLNRLVASTYLDLNQPRLAEPYLVRICGESARMMLTFARIETQLGKAQNAQRAAEMAATMAAEEFSSSNDTAAAALLSNALMLQGKTQEAEQVLLGQMKTDPEGAKPALVDFYTALARRRYKESKLFRQEAVDILARGLKLDPLHLEAAMLFGDLISAGAIVPQDIRDELANAWEQQPDESENEAVKFFVAGRMLKACDRPVVATQRLKRAAELSPKFTEPYAQMLMETERQNEATKVLNALLTELTEKDEPTVLRRALVYRMLGEQTECLRLLREIREPSSRAKTELAHTIVAGLKPDANWEHRLSALQEALDVRPGNSRVLASISSLAVATKEARSQARQMILAKVANGELGASRAYAALGTAASTAGDYENAVEDLSEARRLADEKGNLLNPIILNNLATALLRQENPDPVQSLEQIDLALRQVPGQVDLLVTKGEALVASSEWEAAIRVLVPVVQVRPDHALVHSLLARAYAAVGSDELANEHANRIR